MQINIHGKNVEITQRLRDYAEKKLNRLDRYLPYITDLRLEVAEEHFRKGGDRAVAQLTMHDKRGGILRAEDKTQSDVMAAIDMVVGKMQAQINRYKGKTQSTRRAESRFEALSAPTNDEVEAELAEEQETASGIARRKRIEMTPMSEDEAIEQMELLGHDFFVFFNAESGGVNVLYRRGEGNYGLLEPVVV